jgi:hypothetical protein
MMSTRHQHKVCPSHQWWKCFLLVHSYVTIVAMTSSMSLVASSADVNETAIIPSYSQWNLTAQDMEESSVGSDPISFGNNNNTDDLPTNISSSTGTTATSAAPSTITSNNSTNVNHSSFRWPPEHDPPSTWTVTVSSLFIFVGIVLCSLTAYRTYQQQQRRAQYQPVSNLVV